MKIRAIQFSPGLGRTEDNLAFHIREINKAVKDGSDLIIFPELSLSGYDLKDIVYDVAIKPDSDVIRDFKALSKDIAIIAGMPFEERTGVIYNAALCFSNGEIVHIHRKAQLPNFGMFKEGMIFSKGDSFKTFNLNGYKAGIIICREILFPVNSWIYHMEEADFLIGISNSPFRGLDANGFSSLQLWERMGEVCSLHHNLNYVFVNRSGFENGMGFGGSSFFAPAGRPVEKRCEFCADDSLDCVITKQDVRRSRLSSNYLRDKDIHTIIKSVEDMKNAKN